MIDHAERLDTIQLGTAWFPEVSGGLERYYFDLVHALPQAGVAVQGLVLGSAAVAQATGGRVRAYAPVAAPLPTRLWRARTAVRAALARDPSALVVAHFALSAAPALDLLRGRPVVVHFHGPWGLEGAAEGDPPLKARLKTALERRVYRGADALLVLSRAFGRLLTEHYGVEPARVHVVPPGLQVERFETGLTLSEARRRLGWPEDRPVVLCVRRLVRRMGVEDLIAAMDSVRRHCPDVLLLIAGTGPLQEELRALVQARGLERWVRLLGFLPDADLPVAYRAAALTVVPSLALEGFGLVAAESLAAGTPVVVTPVGGLPDAVAELSSELIATEPGPAALGELIGAVLQGRVRVPSPEACIGHARRFAWPGIARRVAGVYRSAVNGGSR